MKEKEYIRHQPMVRRTERETPKPTTEDLALRWEILAARRYVHDAERKHRS